MKSLVAQAMEAGAFGLSTGLVYPPGCFAETDEIIALCRSSPGMAGSTPRTSAASVRRSLEAVAAAIHIGREAHLPVQISHNAPKIGAPCDAHANYGW